MKSEEKVKSKRGGNESFDREEPCVEKYRDSRFEGVYGINAPHVGTYMLIRGWIGMFQSLVHFPHHRLQCSIQMITNK